MKTGGKFTKLRAATAATFLTVMTLSSDIGEEPEPPPPLTPARIFMTEETRNVYGPYAHVISSVVPNLSVLLVTERDLRFKGSEAARTHLLTGSPCIDSEPPSEEQKQESEQAMAAARAEMINLLHEFSPDNTDNSIIPRNKLRETLNRHSALLNAHLSGASIKALNHSAAALYLTDSYPTIDHRLAIVTMSSELKTPEQNAALFSGLPASYIENMQATAQDWAIFTLGHEIAGHAAHGHAVPHPPGYCATPDFDWNARRIGNETVSDIGGLRVFRAAQRTGLASAAPLERELAAMRALSTLYSNRNLETAQNSSLLGVHATTLGFDPDAPDFKSDMYGHENAYTARAPLLINLAADVVTGFVHSRFIKQDMETRPENYTDRQRAEYANVPVSPQYIERNLTAFASLGQRVRMQYPRNPEWHYEALAFLEENGLFDELMQNIGPDEAYAMRDALDDFFEAVEAHATKLKNPEIARQIRQSLTPAQAMFLTHPRTYGRLPEFRPMPEDSPAPPST